MPDKPYLLFFLFITILLSACVARTPPEISPPPALPEIRTPAQSEPLAEVTAAAQKNLLMQEVLSCMSRVDSLQPSAMAEEIKRLQASLAVTHSLPDSAHSEGLLEKLSLACLLTRDAASDREWQEAEILLTKLAEALEDQEQQWLVQHLQRNLGLKKQLRKDQAQLIRLRRQNQELQYKIEQLKGLERDLDVSVPFTGDSEL